MNKKPIIFNARMVRAIQAGKKTMTRRVIKPQPTHPRWNNIGWLGWDDGHGYKMREPYFPDDILWVRENFREFSGVTYCWQGGAYIPAYDFSGINYYADDEMRRTDVGHWGEMFMPSHDTKQDIAYGKWRPSIHMPRKAARIFLHVIDVWIERLQDISESDAIEEGEIGIPCDHPIGRYACEDCMNTGYLESPIVGFEELWNALYLDKGYGWNENPWVWVIKFEKLQTKESETNE